MIFVVVSASATISAKSNLFNELVFFNFYELFKQIILHLNFFLIFANNVNKSYLLYIAIKNEFKIKKQG